MITIEELDGFAKFLDSKGVRDNALRLKMTKEFTAKITAYREGEKRAKAMGAVSYRKRPDGVWEMPK